MAWRRSRSKSPVSFRRRDDIMMERLCFMDNQNLSPHPPITSVSVESIYSLIERDETTKFPSNACSKKKPHIQSLYSLKKREQVSLEPQSKQSAVKDNAASSTSGKSSGLTGSYLQRIQREEKYISTSEPNIRNLKDEPCPVDFRIDRPVENSTQQYLRSDREYPARTNDTLLKVSSLGNLRYQDRGEDEVDHRQYPFSSNITKLMSHTEKGLAKIVGTEADVLPPSREFYGHLEHDQSCAVNRCEDRDQGVDDGYNKRDATKPQFDSLPKCSERPHDEMTPAASHHVAKTTLNAQPVPSPVTTARTEHSSFNGGSGARQCEKPNAAPPSTNQNLARRSTLRKTYSDAVNKLKERPKAESNFLSRSTEEISEVMAKKIAVLKSRTQHQTKKCQGDVDDEESDDGDDLVKNRRENGTFSWPRFSERCSRGQCFAPGRGILAARANSTVDGTIPGRSPIISKLLFRVMSEGSTLENGKRVVDSKVQEEFSSSGRVRSDSSPDNWESLRKKISHQQIYKW